MKAAKQPGTEGRRQCDSAHARRPEQADPETGGQARGGSGWGQGVASGLALSFAQGPPSLICHSAIRMLMKVMM